MSKGWGTALVLAAATAWFVWWRNSEVAALSDLSYVLDGAFRIAGGQWPYRDFPFIHAPLTFVVQAAIVALGGRHYVNHIAYAAITGAAATWLTWRLLQQELRDYLPSPALAAFALASPLVCLGIYSIFPHPFYDPDTTLTMLVATLLVWRAERRGFPTAATACAGALLALPVFSKQNTGLAFLASAMAALVFLSVIERKRRTAVRGYRLLLAGAAAGLAGGLVALQLTVGLGNYVRWTIQFAAERRLPDVAAMLDIYAINRTLVLWLACAVAAWAASAYFSSRWEHGPRSAGRGRRLAAAALVAHATVVALLAVPFIEVLVAAYRDDDRFLFARHLLALWPYLLAAAAIAAVAGFRQRSGLRRVWPFVLLAAIHGCLMSQQIWGSTYGIWPLFVLLLATVFGVATAPLADRAGRTLTAAAVVAAVALGVGGWRYTVSNERLSHVNVTDGALTASRLPALAGLRTRGPWLEDFDALVAWTSEHIPFTDGVMVLPGEDPFHYATGRLPQFPVTLFDPLENPYGSRRYLAPARAHGIRWVVVKEKLQARALVDAGIAVMGDLGQAFTRVATVRQYAIYRQSPPR